MASYGTKILAFESIFFNCITLKVQNQQFLELGHTQSQTKVYSETVARKMKNRHIVLLSEHDRQILSLDLK